MREIEVKGTRLGFTSAKVIVRKAENGETHILQSPMLNRHEAAKYCGLPLREFQQRQIRKRHNGHSGYYEPDLIQFIENEKHY